MNTTKYPATVRELGDMAEKLGMKASELLEMLGPIPMPPAGYTLARRSGDRWTGPETFNRGWIITPAWNASTNTHSIELWAASHEPPSYANLTPDEALQLAADLTAVAKTVQALA
ncbi:hypothetical protein [Arthrobacter sp. Y81]|uniref:hypothetical protein n=1 Tax=Arthrobacter sp. Y81 TaxID=2058897 RepID=UPI000CE33D06|nr:hypothetical protein [Arthrobacter sp. Y81]